MRIIQSEMTEATVCALVIWKQSLQKWMATQLTLVQANFCSVLGIEQNTLRIMSEVAPGLRITSIVAQALFSTQKIFFREPPTTWISIHSWLEGIH